MSKRQKCPKIKVWFHPFTLSRVSLKSLNKVFVIKIKVFLNKTINFPLPKVVILKEAFPDNFEKKDECIIYIVMGVLHCIRNEISH